MFLWILIFIFAWVLLPIHQDGFKVKKLGKTITKGVAKTANKVGESIAKIATVGLGPDAAKVLKNMGVIKKAIGSFIKKGDDLVSSDPPKKVALVARKCGIQ